MTESIYAPPKADLTTKDEALGDQGFYVVSLFKLTVLFLATAGMYQIYWNYKNWSRYKERAQYEDGLDRGIWPVPRALFSVFFTHSLFREVAAHAARRMRTLNWNVDTHATTLVLLLLASGVTGRLGDKAIGTPYTDIAWALLLVPMLFSYRAAQGHINAACGDPEGRSNSEFTAANWVWIVLGAVFVALIVIGLAMPPDQA